EDWAGLEVHLYGFVLDHNGHASDSQYLGCLEPVNETPEHTTTGTENHIPSRGGSGLRRPSPNSHSSSTEYLDNMALDSSRIFLRRFSGFSTSTLPPNESSL
ncbi:MAG: hypothetical protein ACSW8I_02325, partial [bacterium]